jgi:hypothetical protein
MASAISDCRPSINGESEGAILAATLAGASVFMLRIPGSGTFESGR